MSKKDFYPPLAGDRDSKIKEFLQVVCKARKLVARRVSLYFKESLLFKNQLEVGWFFCDRMNIWMTRKKLASVSVCW